MVAARSSAADLGANIALIRTVVMEEMCRQLSRLWPFTIAG